MVAFVMVPGIGGSDADHWQSLWERQWRGLAARIEPGSWSYPDLEDWVAAIDRSVASAARRDTDVVVIAHSLGCWATSAWLQRNPVPASTRAVLVAPPDPSAAIFPGTEAPSFLGVVPTPLPRPSLVIASADDPYCDLDTATSFADTWGSAFETVGKRGHINAASGLGDWPEGRALMSAWLDRESAP